MNSRSSHLVLLVVASNAETYGKVASNACFPDFTTYIVHKQSFHNWRMWCISLNQIKILNLDWKQMSPLYLQDHVMTLDGSVWCEARVLWLVGWNDPTSEDKLVLFSFLLSLTDYVCASEVHWSKCCSSQFIKAGLNIWWWHNFPLIVSNSSYQRW